MNKKFIRKILVYSIYFMAASLFYIYYPDLLRVRGQTADVFMAFVVSISYLFSLEEGVIMALISGFTKDFIAGKSLGLGALTYIFMALISVYLFRSLLKLGKFTVVLEVFIISLIFVSGSGLVVFLQSGTIFSAKDFFLWWFVNRVLVLSILNTLTSLVFLGLFQILSPISKKDDDIYIRYKMPI